MQGVKSLSVIVFALVLAGIMLLPTRTITGFYAVTENRTESYTVQVPREVVVVEPEKEVVVRSCSNYTTDYGERFDYCDLSREQYRVTNRGSASGEFVVFVGYRTAKDKIYGVNKTMYISVGDYALFDYNQTNDTGIYCYGKILVAPHKTVCSESIEHQKASSVTKTEFRNETRTRTTQLIVPRNETKKVNWLFGFEPLI